MLAGVCQIREAVPYRGAMKELEHRWADLGEFIREQRRVGHLSLRKLSEIGRASCRERV